MSDKPEYIGPKHRIFTDPSVLRPGGNRASVCTWDLTFTFFTRAQCISFINELLESSDIPWNVSYEQKDHNEHIVEIIGMSWAKNLTLVAEILERVDHKG